MKNLLKYQVSLDIKTHTFVLLILALKMSKINEKFSKIFRQYENAHELKAYTVSCET